MLLAYSMYFEDEFKSVCGSGYMILADGGLVMRPNNFPFSIEIECLSYQIMNELLSFEEICQQEILDSKNTHTRQKGKIET